MPKCQSSFGRAASFYQNHESKWHLHWSTHRSSLPKSSNNRCVCFLLLPIDFSFDREQQLYFDDTCVVPERLEGKISHRVMYRFKSTSSLWSEETNTPVILCTYQFSDDNRCLHCDFRFFFPDIVRYQIPLIQRFSSSLYSHQKFCLSPGPWMNCSWMKVKVEEMWIAWWC